MKIGVKLWLDASPELGREFTFPELRDVALRGWWRVAKRLMDFVGAACALVLLSPLMMLMAVLIKLDSRGPAF